MGDLLNPQVDKWVTSGRPKAKMEEKGRDCQPPSGSGGSMEPRIAKLEASVAHVEKDISDMKTDIRDMRKDIRQDFLILAGMIIAAALGLAGLMAKGFKWF